MAKKRSSKASARGKSAPIPVVRNVAELLQTKKLPPGPVIIHFTKEQWTAAIRDVPSGKAVPKYGVRFDFVPNPDGDGGFGQFNCVPGPCEICAIRQRIGPGGTFGTQCMCRRDPRCPPGGGPGGGGGPIVVGRCELRLVRVGRLIRIRCVSVNCTGTCRLRIVRTGQGIGSRWVIVCDCT